MTDQPPPHLLPQPPPNPPPRRPGPTHDTALRRMVEHDPVRACQLLGIPMEMAPRILTASMPSGTLSADLILQVALDRLDHVEYMRDTSADLVARMLIYRGLIMREHPGMTVTQHIVVLGRGTVRGYQGLLGEGFWLDLRVIYLRDLPAEILLTEPGLAPLASLARGTPAQRGQHLAAAVDLIKKAGGARTDELLEFAAGLATIRLDRLIIEKILLEAGMTDSEIAAEFYDTRFGQILVASGREQGRVEMLSELLEERFGDHPGIAAAATRMSAWPAAAAFHAISAAASWEDLPGQPPAE